MTLESPIKPEDLEFIGYVTAPNADIAAGRAYKIWGAAVYVVDSIRNIPVLYGVYDQNWNHIGVVMARTASEARAEAERKFGKPPAPMTAWNVDRISTGDRIYAVYKVKNLEYQPITTPPVTSPEEYQYSPTPPSTSSEYPKTISRGDYSFTANNTDEERALKDFLGIEPAGVDLDTYLSNLDDQGLDQWYTYWYNTFAGFNRTDLMNFVTSKYREYKYKEQLVGATLSVSKSEPVSIKTLDVPDEVKNADEESDINLYYCIPSLAEGERADFTVYMYYFNRETWVSKEEQSDDTCPNEHRLFTASKYEIVKDGKVKIKIKRKDTLDTADHFSVRITRVSVE